MVRIMSERSSDESVSERVNRLELAVIIRLTQEIEQLNINKGHKERKEDNDNNNNNNNNKQESKIKIDDQVIFKASTILQQHRYELQ